MIDQADDQYQLDPHARLEKRTLTRRQRADVHQDSSGRSAFDEREVMTSTYLALTKGSAATDDTDRQMILTALFRKSSDGTVKDDSGFDPLAAILVPVGMGGCTP